MAVQIGKDNTLRIKEDVFNKICKTLKRYHYETGGIVGIDENGVISEFQFDDIQNPKMYEYWPNIKFLNRVINKEWKENNITFGGFIHSHLHNCEISQNDIKYARSILESNTNINNILIGVLDLSKNMNEITWNFVYYNDLKLVRKIDIAYIEGESKK